MVGEARTKAIAAGIAAGMVSAMGLLTLANGRAEARAFRVEQVSPAVARIVAKAAKDPAAARTEIVAVYRQGRLATGDDYVEAAEILGGSEAKGDLALAHDLAVAGLALGSVRARPLVARTEDRLFASLGLGERYGTLGGKSLPLTENHRLLMGLGLPEGPTAVRAMGAVAD